MSQCQESEEVREKTERKTSKGNGGDQEDKGKRVNGKEGEGRNIRKRGQEKEYGVG